MHGVVFHAPSGETPDALQAWLRLVGNAPQSFQSNQPGMPPGGTAVGQVGAYQFMVAAQVGRYELVLSPTAVGDAPPAPTAQIDDIVQVLAAYMPKLMTSAGSGLLRVAVVLNLSKRTDTLDIAVSEFKKDTKLTDIPANASDLQLAINVRRRFSNLPFDMNRLCRWATGVQQFFTMQLTVGTVGPALAVQEFSTETLQIDVNSAPQAGQLPLESATAMFNELVAEALILTSQGYDRLVS